ncbi:MAG: 30S ribosomal protein S15 [Candidatus Yanofskybacteria bacterium CG10_big_fil_rev_8_21_14_0_10_46_23]|uniref:Small ribosomal subunit protein uS15 n=1 Tax=Candidatus Yanofskybacteria bacterium CG10_big_fil_rev_8_21_14_0_10_46_23 TaxID=1975098 RepID=A0A2H0R436_9BACT|nr:MAG: 30S ribosomal protein S15 [Candidatus Yanofskybacteria bacterium CG10_big_fil_rev_8_21_14_0_10_46_23]
MLSVQQKTNTVKKFARKEGDTGSPEVQIALFTKEIDFLSKHLRKHKKDNSSRTGLLKMVNKRRRLLKYLEKESSRRYNAVIKVLGLKR